MMRISVTVPAAASARAAVRSATVLTVCDCAHDGAAKAPRISTRTAIAPNVCLAMKFLVEDIAISFSLSPATERAPLGAAGPYSSYADMCGIQGENVSWRFWRRPPPRLTFAARCHRNVTRMRYSRRPRRGGPRRPRGRNDHGLRHRRLFGHRRAAGGRMASGEGPQLRDRALRIRGRGLGAEDGRRRGQEGRERQRQEEGGRQALRPAARARSRHGAVTAAL